MDNNNNPSKNPQDPSDVTSPGFFSILLSTLSAAIGIQSQQNQERDFSKGKIGHYILAGLIFTAAFVGTIVLIVQTVLKNAGV